MGGAVVKDISEEQGGIIAKTLREEYEHLTCGDHIKSSAELQRILTAKFNEIAEHQETNSLGDSLTYSAISEEDENTVNMLKTLTLKGTHFLDLMNYFESDENAEYNSNFEGLDGVEPPKPEVVDPWTQTMDMRSYEVEFLLRRPLNCDDDIRSTLAAAEAGLFFLDELNEVAASLKINRGTLSRWLLPFDTNTSIAEQSSDLSSVDENTPPELKGKITNEQLKFLVGGVNGVRQLVRVKIADDNDLETATAAVRTTTEFLTRLIKAAADMTENGQITTPHELLKSHQFV